MWIKEVLVAISGFAAGALVSAGVFALITSIGVIPRLADKSRTAAYVKSYETSVILGGIFGNLVNIYKLPLSFTPLLLPVFGIFSGIFVGCLATSLAESLNTTAIFSRRVKLHRGTGVIILCAAIGKVIGSLIFFYLGWY